MPTTQALPSPLSPQGTKPGAGLKAEFSTHSRVKEIVKKKKKNVLQSKDGKVKTETLGQEKY